MVKIQFNISMKKLLLSAMLISFSAFTFSQEFSFNAEPQPNEYIEYINTFDWGPAVDKLLLCLDHNITETAVNKKDFIVRTHMVNKDNSAKSYGPALGERIITDAFLSDKSGNKISGRGTFITLLLEVHPAADSSRPFISFAKPADVDDLYGYRIENKKLEIEIGKRTAVTSDDLKIFSKNEFKGIEGTMNYTMYLPETSKTTEKKIPLIVWFHGLGEGGDNHWLPLLGNNAPNLAKEKIQKHFKNGAAVLVPQSKVCWLQSTTTDKKGRHKWVIFDDVQIKNSLKNKLFSPFSKLSSTSPYGNTSDNNENTVSLYTTTVMELIDSVLEQNPDIDKNKIILMGCSAGGYMVLNMGLEYPDRFAAMVACCPAYPFKKFNYNAIEKILEKPIWIIYAKNDDTLKPEKFAEGVITRFENSGATNLHKTVFENVIDTRGKYFMDYTDDLDERAERIEKNKVSNKPYEYGGHESWIYLLNDECSDGSLNLYDWLDSICN